MARLDKTRILIAVLASLFVFVSVRTVVPILLSVTSEPSAEIVSVDLCGGKVVEGFNLYAILRGETTGPYDSFYRVGSFVGVDDWHLDSGFNQRLFRENYPGVFVLIPSKNLPAGQRTATVYLQQVSNDGAILAEDTEEVTFTVLSKTEAQNNAKFKLPEWQITASKTKISALVQNNADFQDWLCLKVSRDGAIVASGVSEVFFPNSEGTLSVQGDFTSGDTLELWSAATDRKLDSCQVVVSETPPPQNENREQGDWLQQIQKMFENQLSSPNIYDAVALALAAIVGFTCYRRRDFER